RRFRLAARSGCVTMIPEVATNTGGMLLSLKSISRAGSLHARRPGLTFQEVRNTDRRLGRLGRRRRAALRALDLPDPIPNAPSEPRPGPDLRDRRYGRADEGWPTSAPRSSGCGRHGSVASRSRIGTGWLPEDHAG